MVHYGQLNTASGEAPGLTATREMKIKIQSAIIVVGSNSMYRNPSQSINASCEINALNQCMRFANYTFETIPRGSGYLISRPHCFSGHQYNSTPFNAEHPTSVLFTPGMPLLQPIGFVS